MTRPRTGCGEQHRSSGPTRERRFCKKLSSGSLNPHGPGPSGNREATMQPDRCPLGRISPKPCPESLAWLVTPQSPAFFSPLCHTVPQNLTRLERLNLDGNSLPSEPASLARLPAGPQAQRQPSSFRGVARPQGKGLRGPGEPGRPREGVVEGRVCPRVGGGTGWGTEEGAPAWESSPGL